MKPPKQIGSNQSAQCKRWRIRERARRKASPSEETPWKAQEGSQKATLFCSPMQPPRPLLRLESCNDGRILSNLRCTSEQPKARHDACKLAFDNINSFEIESCPRSPHHKCLPFGTNSASQIGCLGLRRATNGVQAACAQTLPCIRTLCTTVGAACPCLGRVFKQPSWRVGEAPIDGATGNKHQYKLG